MDWKGVTSETCSNVKCLEWAYSVTQLLSFGCMLSAAKAHESRTMQNARQRLALDGLRSHATECTINRLSKNRFPFVTCLSAECPPSHQLYMRSRSVSVLSQSLSPVRSPYLNIVLPSQPEVTNLKRTELREGARKRENARGNKGTGHNEPLRGA